MFRCSMWLSLTVRLQTELAVNTHVIISDVHHGVVSTQAMVSDIHRSMLGSQGAAGDENRLVSDTASSVSRYCMTKRPPFHRLELGQ